MITKLNEKNYKCYVLMVARVFPFEHPRKGEDTNFKQFIMKQKKIHTIRGNYDLWKKRIDKINTGEAYLSLRQWEGKAYHSKQPEFLSIDKIGLQKLTIVDHGNFWYMRIDSPDGTPKIHSDCIDGGGYRHDMRMFEMLSSNDGLGIVDFKNWFEKYDLSKPMAIIHFTGFRY